MVRDSVYGAPGFLTEVGNCITAAFGSVEATQGGATTAWVDFINMGGGTQGSWNSLHYVDWDHIATF